MRNALKILELAKGIHRDCNGRVISNNDVYETIAEELFRADRGRDIVLHVYMMEQYGDISKGIEYNPDYSAYTVTYGDEDYQVYSEWERETALDDEIIETLFAFRPGFLSEMTGVDVEVFDTLCGLCESSSKAIAAIIQATCGFNKFKTRALETDGAGSFLAKYDSKERTVRINGETFYIYKVR
jgi:hypothetical protein